MSTWRTRNADVNLGMASRHLSDLALKALTTKRPRQTLGAHMSLPRRRQLRLRRVNGGCWTTPGRQRGSVLESEGNALRKADGLQILLGPWAMRSG